uniref:SSD domain-containing protein n=1 Tax=Panagrellus redivivus TaxID=6233 RepID=A0A7E4ZUE0_PANRE
MSETGFEDPFFVMWAGPCSARRVLNAGMTPVPTTETPADGEGSSRVGSVLSVYDTAREQFVPVVNADSLKDAAESVEDSESDDYEDAPPMKANRGSARSKSKLGWIRRYMSLKGVFHLLGRSVAICPQAYIIISLLISTLSFGMYYMVLKDQIRDGYTPTNAPSRHEIDVMREFWNSTGDPIMSIVLLSARDNGSMLRDDYFAEAVRVHNYLYHNFSYDYEGEAVKYENLCHPYCSMNYVLDMFYNGAEEQKKRLRNGTALDEDTQLQFPVSNVDGFKIHMDRTFFGIKVRNESTPVDKYEGRTFEKGELVDGMDQSQIVTNLDFVKVIMLIFRGDRTDQRKNEMLSRWELNVYEFSENFYNHNNSQVEMQVVGTEILDQEMLRDGQRMTPFFAAGFGFLILFVMATVLCSAWFYNELDIGKVFVSIMCTVCPLLAISTAFGFVSLLGLRINSFVLVSPFLICGIGVDDAFLMIHAWQRLAPDQLPLTTRLGLVFEEVGPSITITSLTNFISFGIGSFTPTPEIRLFCMTTTIAVGFDYIFQLILFGPCIALASRFEKKKTAIEDENAYNHGLRKTINDFAQGVLHVYCKIIGHRIFTGLLVIAVGTYWYFAVYGAMAIQTRLDSQKILPKDSPIQKPNKVLHETVWAEYHTVTVIVNKPVDITNATQYARFWSLVNEYESMPLNKGNDSTLLWLRDYEDYYKNGDLMTGFLSFLGYEEEEQEVTTSPTGIDFSKLEQFLESPIYKHWKASVKLDKHEGTNETYVSSFWFALAYHNTSEWDTRIKLMIEWREIADRFADMNVTVWEANSMFVDQMLSLKTVALQTGLLTLICMLVVCAIFIPNPCSLITASIAIASISLGVFGFLSWWHFDLDPVTMAAILMSIGLSVDFTAHISYHYQLTTKKVRRNGKIVKVAINGTHEKLVNTLENVGWPMIQAGASTIVCILPLLFLKSYAPEVFVKTIFLVVAWGVLHGLLVLPGFLAALPDCVTSANCYHFFLSKSSDKSCRYVGEASADNDVAALGSKKEQMQELVLYP